MQPFTIFVVYTAKPGCAEAFIRDIREAGIDQAIRAEEGCLSYRYFLPAEGGDVILLTEQWESPAHQKKHMEQPHMAALMEIKTKYIEASRLYQGQAM